MLLLALLLLLWRRLQYCTSLGACLVCSHLQLVGQKEQRPCHPARHPAPSDSYSYYYS